MKNEKKVFKGCNFIGSVVIVVFMLVAVLAGVAWMNLDLNLAMLASIGIAILVLMLQGCKWKLIEDAIGNAGKIVTHPTIILLLVGGVVSTWIASGTIPSIIYWGLQIINPSFFVVSAFILCAVISIMTGSSLSSVGTVGIALIVMTNVLEINPALTAGAIISGAYLGDKMSPLSDTTNLSAAVAEADLFDHIKAMLYTSVPAVVICLILYTVFGFGNAAESVSNEQLDNIFKILGENYNINILTLIPPVLVLIMAIKRVPAIIAMMISIITASLIAIFVQGVPALDLTAIIFGGYTADLGDDFINTLLSRGGISSMFWTAIVGILAVTFGDILEKGGVFDSLVLKLMNVTKTVGGLTAVTTISCVAVNILTGEQYMSILLPGKMFQKQYKDKKLLPQVLSRTLEGGGTVTAPLVPWNLGGLNCTRLLGISTYQYLPYCFLGFTLPLINILFGFLNKFMWVTGEIESKKTYEETV